MELFTADFWAAIGSIIIIDLVLAGDNAIVIGLASRNLPAHLQKKAIYWGMAGAVIIRIALTLVAVWLLRVPGLQLAGGIALLWIAYKLMTDDKDDEDVQAAGSIGGAVRTIIIADAVMGIDNVLAVAGAAQGHVVLVVIGLLISVPIVVWGSTIILRLMERFPVIIYIGTAVIALTAGRMITEEPFIEHWFEAPAVKWTFVAALIAAVLLLGYFTKKSKRSS